MPGIACFRGAGWWALVCLVFGVACTTNVTTDEASNSERLSAMTRHEVARALGTAEPADLVCGEAAPLDLDAPAGSWTNVTAMVGLPAIRSTAASARDLDSDGYPDLLVASDNRSVVEDTDGTLRPFEHTEVYLNCRGRRFAPLGLADRVTGAPLMDDVRATAMSDINGDGRVDILLGGERQVQILLHEPGLTFRASTILLRYGHAGTPLPTGAMVSSMLTADLDGDGVLDLYVGTRLSERRLGDHPETSPDFLFLGKGDGTFAQADATLGAPIAECCTSQTFGMRLIRRTPFGLPDVLYVGMDRTFDAAIELPLRADGKATWYGMPAFSYPAPPATMGVDHEFVGDNGDVVLAASCIGRNMLMALPAGARDLVDLTERVDYGDYERVSWGISLNDANLDGVLDLTVAYGELARAPWGEAIVPEGPGALPRLHLNSLRHYRGSGDPTRTLPDQLIDVGAAAGLEFSPGLSGTDDMDAVLKGQKPEDVQAMRREWFTLADLDFDRDGCLDHLVSVRRQMKYMPEVFETFVETDYYTPTSVTLLKGSCGEARWLGIIVADIPATLVEVRGTIDGRPFARWQQVATNAALGASSDANAVRFGFGDADDVRLDVVNVHTIDGDVIPVPGLRADETYHVVSAPLLALSDELEVEAFDSGEL